jgi:hypothetical protein
VVARQARALAERMVELMTFARRGSAQAERALARLARRAGLKGRLIGVEGAASATGGTEAADAGADAPRLAAWGFDNVVGRGFEPRSMRAAVRRNQTPARGAWSTGGSQRVRPTPLGRHAYTFTAPRTFATSLHVAAATSTIWSASRSRSKAAAE